MVLSPPATVTKSPQTQCLKATQVYHCMSRFAISFTRLPIKVGGLAPLQTLEQGRSLYSSASGGCLHSLARCLFPDLLSASLQPLTLLAASHKNPYVYIGPSGLDRIISPSQDPDLNPSAKPLLHVKQHTHRCQGSGHGHSGWEGHYSPYLDCFDAWQMGEGSRSWLRDILPLLLWGEPSIRFQLRGGPLHEPSDFRVPLGEMQRAVTLEKRQLENQRSWSLKGWEIRIIDEICLWCIQGAWNILLH